MKKKKCQYINKHHIRKIKTTTNNSTRAYYNLTFRQKNVYLHPNLVEF